MRQQKMLDGMVTPNTWIQSPPRLFVQEFDLLVWLPNIWSCLYFRSIFRYFYGVILSYILFTTHYLSSQCQYHFLFAGTEILGGWWRMALAVLNHIPFSLGHTTLPAIAYYARDWHTFQLAISLPALLLIAYWWWEEICSYNNSSRNLFQFLIRK
jgi:uncharacterized membrane protein